VEADKFRELAETHGEEFTNEWLRALAWVCRQESRTTDVVGRVGGEEFAVLLPSTELSGGLVLAERIRERMQRHVFHGAFQAVRCTVSVGVAELSDNITSVDGLLSASGTAVERARQAGRNLVVGYDA
jgi:diguanylate cyclase (GGDEF)-like protein